MSIPSVAPALVPRSPDGPCGRLLSNGSLTTLVTAAGTGATWRGARRVTGWTPDPVEDRDGILLYLRDEDDGRSWSAALAPVAGAPDRYAVSAGPGALRIERAEHGIEAVCEIAVAADADVDLRRLRLTNASGRRRHLSVTSYLALVLHDAAAHAAHPGFSKLFVQTRLDAATGLLLARRRPRGPEPEALALAHSLCVPGAASVETDRARFLGRGRSLADPAAQAPGAALTGGVGNVLDPIASQRREVTLEPGAAAEWLCVVAAGASEAEAQAAALRFAEPTAFEAARDGAARCAREARERCGLDAGQGEYLEALLVAMLYGAPALRAPEAVLRRARGSADDLWILGLPPDRPLVVVEGEGALAAELARAAAYWAGFGVPVSILALGAGAAASDAVAVPEPGTDPRFLDVARACARLVVRDAWPRLAPEPAPASVAAHRPLELRSAAPAPARSRLRFHNGLGGFAEDGSEYVIEVPGEPGGGPPMPWVNVLANPGFGSLVSERGAAVTWSRNSQAHRLTPWSNDPIADPHGEALWVRDEAARVFWSPQPGPTPCGAPCEVRHGFGTSSWRSEALELAQEVVTLVAPDAPVKLTRVRLTNRSGAARSLSLFAYARLVQGSLPENDARAIAVDAAGDGRALFATNGIAGPFAGGVAFAASASDAADGRVSWSADRIGFLGAGGSPARPRALEQDERLDGRSGAPLEACFAQQLRFTLAAGATVTCVALLGEADDAAQAEALVARFGAPEACEAALAAVRAQWQDTLGAVRVATPSPALDLMVNGWLGYQTLSCRLWGRTAFYQSGGAFGFRDQLQDAAALVLLRPDLTRAHLLLHAAHQFPEGDVLHWWHPPLDRGTRTRFSDDLLWLPYLTAHYVAATGDRGVLDERVPFVTARELAEGEDEAYLPTGVSSERADLYDHCCRAIDRSLRVGAHGLPLMGSGDWNDGMNLVGREGRGESVWMAFFLADVLRGFEPLAAARGDAARAQRYAEHRAALARACEEHAWDGAWYRRAWFDDGTPLGTAGASECCIDVLPQAWSVISGAAPRARAETAMDSVERELVMPEGELIRLLAPPFDRMQPTPGYIQGYVPGIRENGGQYTHGATWAVRATAELGRRARALELLEMLTPVHHARSPERVAVYQVEPYAVAADVYAVPPHVGRGGWTWYTGSSGWMLRVALESVLGLTVEEGRRLVLRPCVPDAWPGFRIEYRLPDRATRYAIAVRSPAGSSARVVGVRLDREALAPVDGAAVVPIAADGARHEVEVELGA